MKLILLGILAVFVMFVVLVIRSAMKDLDDDYQGMHTIAFNPHQLHEM